LVKTSTRARFEAAELLSVPLGSAGAIANAHAPRAAAAAHAVTRLDLLTASIILVLPVS
jgi:hypothetical protein